MPYTKIGKPKYEMLRGLIVARLDALDMTYADLGKKCGMSESTVSRRMNNQGKFTIEELSKIGRVLHIPIEDFRLATIRY